MSVVITIVKFPENVSNTRPTITFAENGGTIGRGPDNSWVLEDPERFISSCHSKISYEGGQYYLVDASTNGTFHNGASEPVGKDNKVLLNDGDSFALGDYEFQVSVWSSNQAPVATASDEQGNNGPFAAAQPPAASPATGENFPNDPFTPPTDGFASDFGSMGDSFASPMPGHVSTAEPLFGNTSLDEKDPLAALDKANNQFPASSFESQSMGADVFSNNSHSDQADALDQSIAWPDATQDPSMIPEDWDDSDDLMSTPTPEPMPAAKPAKARRPAKKPRSLNERKKLLDKANRHIQSEIKLLKEQSSVTMEQPVIKPVSRASRKSGKVSHSDISLIESMGLDKENLTTEQISDISNVVGELVRESIAGMMMVLSSRSSIKNEFRMNVTTIQPVENNPLKFSANIEDAMENMFLRSGNAFIKPVEAMREGFDGIAEHQVAILAGIRSAFNGIIDRFNPDTLEQRFEKFHKGGILPGSSKARNWESYCAYYKELVDDMDNSFQHLFGYDFVQAYEDQLQKLADARKTKR